MNLYMITDLRNNSTQTITLDVEGFHRAREILRKENRKEYRYEIEAVETNKALRP